jgi:hypothetical protein
MNHCEDCAFWHFPTKTVYMGLHTHGYCVVDKDVMPETVPNHTCPRWKHEKKPPALHHAAAQAIRLINRKEFADKMNDNQEPTIESLQKAIDVLMAKKQAEPEVMAHAPRKVELHQGQDVEVVYRDKFKFIIGKKVGDKTELVLARPDGSLVIVDDKDFEFRIPKC